MIADRRQLAALFAGILVLGARADSAPAGVTSTPVFAALSKAWTDGNARALVQHFGKRRVYISLPEGGPAGGQFSRDQSYFIFKDLFEAAPAEEFTFVTTRQPEERPDTALGVARRVYRPRDGGRVVRDRVFVSLTLEGGRWVVAEIKSVR